jgi:hypothetical protein
MKGTNKQTDGCLMQIRTDFLTDRLNKMLNDGK